MERPRGRCPLRMSERKATILTLIAAAAIFVFLQRHQPAVVLGATAFAIGWCWFWLCRRHPLIAMRSSAFCVGCWAAGAEGRQSGCRNPAFARIRA